MLISKKVNYMSFNYIDAFNSSSQLEYKSKQHDASVEIQGRRCYVFLLDRKKTEVSEVYNEAKNGRIYLPHFEQRALYSLNEFQGLIGLNNYVEKEDTLKFEFNFARMVCNIRDLKDKKAGKLMIKNISNEIFLLSIENNKFVVKSKNQVILLEEDLTKYKSITAFINSAKKRCSVIDLSYEGDMEEAKNINSVSMRLVPNRKEEIWVNDRLYENCGDVIDNGDIILTDKYKLYQVNNAYPTGAMVNEYTSWTCHCNVTDIAIANLPDDYRKIITRNSYGLPKTNLKR